MRKSPKDKKEVSLYIKREDVGMYIKMRKYQLLPSVKLLKNFFRETQEQTLLISEGPLGLVIYGQIEETT